MDDTQKKLIADQKKIPTPNALAQLKSATLIEKTGKGWMEWYDILDRIDALKQGREASATYLQEEYQISGWWATTIVARYEQVLAG